MHPVHSSRTATAPVRLAALALALAASGACGGRAAHDPRLPPPLVLDVQNHGYFDIAVYAAPGGAGPGTRLGLVPGVSRARLAVRPADLQHGDQLVLRLHAIGTRHQWVSPAVTMSDGIVARLEVYTDADGRMTRSTLHTAPVTTSARWILAARAP